jgi:hypothetical protein
MKPNQAVVIVKHEDKQYLKRIGVLVSFDKEEEQWILQLPEGRMMIKESQLQEISMNTQAELLETKQGN